MSGLSPSDFTHNASFPPHPEPSHPGAAASPAFRLILASRAMPPAGTHPSRSGKCLRWLGPCWLGGVGTRPGEASPAPAGGRVPAECGGLASPPTCLGCAQGSGWVANRALDVQKCRSARGERLCLSRKSPREPALPGVMCWASLPGPLSSDHPVVGGDTQRHCDSPGKISPSLHPSRFSSE